MDLWQSNGSFARAPACGHCPLVIKAKQLSMWTEVYASLPRQAGQCHTCMVLPGRHFDLTVTLSHSTPHAAPGDCSTRVFRAHKRRRPPVLCGWASPWFLWNCEIQTNRWSKQDSCYMIIGCRMQDAVRWCCKEFFFSVLSSGVSGAGWWSAGSGRTFELL